MLEEKANKETLFRHSISRCKSSDISSLAKSTTAVDMTRPELRRQEQRAMVSNIGIKISAEKRSSSPKLHRHRNHHCHTKSEQLEEGEAFELQQSLSDLAITGAGHQW